MSDDKRAERPDAGRRSFLKLASISAPAAAIAAAAGEAEAATEAPAAGRGLRKTAHVKKYLETARF